MTIAAAIQTISWFLGAATLAATQPAAAATPATIVDRPQVEAAGLTVYWQRSIPLEKGEQLLRIDRLEENLYAITDRGRVVTLDAITGVDRWMATPAGPKIRLLGPTHGPDLVYFATVQGIQAFDRVHGDRQMNWKGKLTPSSPIASDGDELYFGTVEARVVSLRIQDMLETWQFATAGTVHAAPILLGPDLYVVSQGGRVYAAKKHDKERIWEAAVTGPVQAAPAVRNNHLYVAGMDQSLWCFDLVNGWNLWRRRLPSPLTEPPQATADALYLPVPYYGLYSIQPHTGQIVWQREEGLAFLTEQENLAWLMSSRSSLLGCDRASGQVRQEIGVGADLWVSNVVDDPIWLASRSGTIVCLRPAGAGFLRYGSARRAAGRATMPSTRPGDGSSEQEFIPEPPPRPPVDYLRRQSPIPPVGGNATTSQPGGQ